jgi:hypothetical protein
VYREYLDHVLEEDQNYQEVADLLRRHMILLNLEKDLHEKIDVVSHDARSVTLSGS